MRPGQYVRFSVAICALTVCLFLAGCDRQQEKGVSTASLGLAYDDLPMSTVLIRIGDMAYSKQDLEDEMSLMLQLRKLGDPRMTDKQADNLRRTTVPALYENARRVLLYKADARSKVIDPDEKVVKKSKSGFQKIARRTKGTFEDLKKELDDSARRKIDLMIRDDAIVQAYLKQKAGTRSFEATAEEIGKMRDYNARRTALTIEETNKSWNLATNIVKKLDAGANFDDMIDKYSIAKEFDQVGSGDWYVTAPNLILDEKLRVEVAKTPVGEHTVPVETSEGIYIVKVLGRTGHGEISMVNKNPEKLRLRRIVVRLPMPPLEFDEKVAAKAVEDLHRGDFQRELQKELLEKFQIEYPCGTNIWGRVVKSGAK